MLDSNSATTFLSFFIPRLPDAFDMCGFLADKYKEVADAMIGLHLESHQPGEGPVRSTEYPFSGRISVYHEDLFTPQQVGGLYEYFKRRKLKLELRGPEYLQAWIYRHSNSK
jgi:hypothetical protein